MLSLRVELLTGRYVASEFNNRNRAEWPPHPARVFSALVAAYHEAGRPEHGEAALRWLECLEPPQMTFSAASTRDLKIHYVPVNDKAISDASMVSNAWTKVFTAETDKQQTKAEAQLAKAYAKVSEPDKTLGKKFREVAAHVLPGTRTKQPRTFPTVLPEDPVLHYSWEDSPDPNVRAGLDAIAAALVRVGHSSSLVSACWVAGAPEPTWVPDARGGEALRWVGPGQLARLNALHSETPFAEQRVMPYRMARYRPARREVPVRSSRFAADFIVLQRVEGPRLPVLAAESVADAVRKALMSHAGEPTPSLISGHRDDGEPLTEDHLAVVALPYVGGSHASGDLLGVALVPPAGLSLTELQPVYGAIARWEQANLTGSSMPRVVLKLGKLGRWELQRNLELTALHNLRESTWTRASRGWASVTPMVLDRYPGSRPMGHPETQRRIRETIIAACERVGLPAPAQIEVGQSPYFNGSAKAGQFIRRDREDTRPLLHSWLLFDEPVIGPILLGAGRYRGLGLFRPYGESE
jgi:CRISPR-associated protein Csb2